MRIAFNDESNVYLPQTLFKNLPSTIREEIMLANHPDPTVDHVLKT